MKILLYTGKTISPRGTLYDFDQHKQNQYVFGNKVWLIKMLTNVQKGAETAREGLKVAKSNL